MKCSNLKEPPKNEEYELKVFRREYDPLVKEEKKCKHLVSIVESVHFVTIYLICWRRKVSEIVNNSRLYAVYYHLITGSAKECQLLTNAVWKSLVEIRIQPFIQRWFSMCNC